MGSKKRLEVVEGTQRRELSEMEQTELELRVSEYQFSHAGRRVVEEAKYVLDRLRWAMRDIERDIERAEATYSQGNEKGAAMDEIDREYQERLARLAQTTTDAVLSQVGNMNLGYSNGRVLEVAERRHNLAASRRKLEELRKLEEATS